MPEGIGHTQGPCVFTRLGIMEYARALALQKETQATKLADPNLPDTVFFVEHRPVYTLGRRGGRENLTVSQSFLDEKDIQIIQTDRGGNITYHGPGQAVLYPVVDLAKNRLSVPEFVAGLEEIMKLTCRKFSVTADRDDRNHGIWVGNAKIGSVGISLKKGISIHGLALNINPDLTPFSWINPCGLSNQAMTSIARETGQAEQILGRAPGQSHTDLMDRICQSFADCFSQVFGTDLIRQEKKRNPTMPCDLHTPCKGPAAKGSGRAKAKPPWLRKKLPAGGDYQRVTRLLSKARLHTVCQEANCPNMFECFSKDTSTFMILGSQCSRNCRFCNVTPGTPELVDPQEPGRVAEAAKDLGLRYVVVTSVTRDDLPDGGAAQFAATIAAIKEILPVSDGSPARVEVLIPDFQGDTDALKIVVDAKPDVLNHNIETVPSLYPRVRPEAIYQRSLDLIAAVKKLDPSMLTKSGIMVGLGETVPELEQTMADLKAHGCDILTIGQYLQPTRNHLPVHTYYTPEQFDALEQNARAMGFQRVAAGPHVRSSYKAHDLFDS